MKFSQLKLNGFKSFVEHTIIDIKPGLTGIIGPNGCGKSNILEALRWVMGASSAKALRADNMDNIIFSGSEKRPARNHAHVSLIVDNHEFTAPLAYNQFETLEIMRHIGREEGSTYRINGKQVLAKEIRLLFADAHTGANSPAFVRQGQVNMLIASKPENRRMIIEEAAGITGLRVRKREAELRLNAAEQNLERLSDVIIQHQQNLSDLERQARQSRRYRELSEKIRHSKEILACHQWVTLKLNIDQSNETISLLQKHYEEIIKKTSKSLSETEACFEQVEAKRTEESTMRSEFQQMTIKEDLLKRDQKELILKIDRFEKDNERVHDHIKREKTLLDQSETAYIKQKNEEKELTNQQKNEESVSELENQIQNLNQKLTLAETEFSKLQKSFLKQQSEQEVVRKEIERIQSWYHHLEYSVKQLNVKQSSLFSIESLRRELDSLKIELERLEKDKHQTKQECDRLTQCVSDKTAKQSAQKDIVENKKLERAQAETEKITIESFLQENRAKTEWAPVINQIKVEAGYEKALAAALGDDLKAGLDKKALKRWTETKVESPNKLPDHITSLDHYVKAPKALMLRLSQIGVVSSSEMAENTILCMGQKLVSRKGDIWRWDGYISSSKAPISSTAKQFEYANKLETLTGKLTLLVNEEEQEIKRLKSMEIELEIQKTELFERDQHINQVESLQQKKQMEYNTLKTRKRELETQHKELIYQIEKLTQDQQKTKQSLVKRERYLTEIKPDSKIMERLNEKEQQIEHIRQVLITRQVQKEAFETEYRNRKRQIEKIREEQKAWQERIQISKQYINALEQEKIELEIQRVKAKKQPEQFEKKQKQLLTEKEICEKKLKQLSDQFVALQASAKEKELFTKQLEKQQAEISEKLAIEQTKKENLQQGLKEIHQKIEDEFTHTPEKLIHKIQDFDSEIFLNSKNKTSITREKTNLPNSDGFLSEKNKKSQQNPQKNISIKEIAEFVSKQNSNPKEEKVKNPIEAFQARNLNMEKIQRHIEKMIQTREKLGIVNLRAEIEAEELSEKLNHLQKDHDDLTQAINKLRTGILRINQQGRKQLIKAFNQVNTYFQDIFKTLFKGGEAKLALTETEDLLDAGLEIYASPPGKKISILSLMSGGEQALTAIALIFAVFLTQPSPLCVLDEVDAPLDDHNVERFCHMIRKISEQTGTYFMLITHNPVTMARLDRLYGVSMAERGVSQLVSVSLEKAEEIIVLDQKHA